MQHMLPWILQLIHILNQQEAAESDEVLV